MANLDAFQSIKTGLFVKLPITDYRHTSTGSFSSQTLTFSDYDRAKTINSIVYTPLGSLLNVTTSNSELRPTADAIKITLSGIPTLSIPEIVHSKIKGSPITIFRGYFEQNETQIGGYETRFIGSVNNYDLIEDYDVTNRTASNTIVLECSNTATILTTKFAGLQTNPQSMKSFYPTDTSMDRVPTLKGTKFNFGAPE